MSPRSHLRSGLVALGLATLAACNDSSTQPQQPALSPLPANLAISTSCKVTEIYQIITWLTPLRNAPLDLRGPATVVLTFSTVKQTLAQQLVMKLAQGITPAVIAKLNTPPNPPYATKEAAVSVLIADLMQCAGIPVTQAPPPAAYLPSGGLKVIDQTGGQFTTGDDQAGLRVPTDAVVGPHLFVIAETTPPAGDTPIGLAAATTNCLPATNHENVLEVGRCYDLSVIPDVGAKAAGGGFGSGVYAALCSPGVHGDEVHEYLELAKVNHEDPTKFTIYQRATDALTGTMTCDLGAGPPPPTASVMGTAWYRMVGAAKLLARPFAPRVAYASDGVGSFFADFTRARLVYRTRPLTVSPASATVNTGDSQGFTAAPADGGTARGGTYVWSVNGADVGAAGFTPAYGTLAVATSGLAATYTAPATVPPVSTFNVCARRVSASADRGCAAITVKSPLRTSGEVLLLGDVNMINNNAGPGHNASNAQFIRNVFAYPALGPRASQTGVMFHRGHSSSCAIPEDPYCTPADLTDLQAVLTAPAVGASIREVTAPNAEIGPIPSDVKLLFLLAPTTSYSSAEIGYLKQFGAEGGLIVFVNDFYPAGARDAENAFLGSMSAEIVNTGGMYACEDLPVGALQAHVLTTGMAGLSMACATGFQPGPTDTPLVVSTTETDAVTGKPVVLVTLANVSFLNGPAFALAPSASMSAVQRRASLGDGVTLTGVGGRLPGMARTPPSAP